MNRLCTAELLRQVPPFANLSPEQLETLGRYAFSRKFRKGEALFHEKEPGHTLYVVLSGAINIERVTPDGGLVHVARRGTGEIVGEMSLIDGKPRMADAVTAEASELLVLEQNGFLGCIRESPEVALSIMAYLAERLRQAGDRLESVQTLDVLGRVCSRLLELAENGGTPDVQGGTRLANKVTQQSIAEQIGSTRESVNRAFADLKRIGALRSEGRQLIVTDLDKLRRYCHQW